MADENKKVEVLGEARVYEQERAARAEVDADRSMQALLRRRNGNYGLSKEEHRPSVDVAKPE